ncbi:uncharacterized protein LOC102800638 isoform X2 [Saccoglossus kowalevskii]
MVFPRKYFLFIVIAGCVGYMISCVQWFRRSNRQNQTWDIIVDFVLQIPKQTPVDTRVVSHTPSTDLVRHIPTPTAAVASNTPVATKADEAMKTTSNKTHIDSFKNTLEILKFLPLHGHPSMGMKAIVAAMSFCKHLTVYGFYPYRFAPDGHEVFYHYYGREANKTCEDGVRGKHHLNEEFELIRTLHENNVIRLVLEKCQ